MTDKIPGPPPEFAEEEPWRDDSLAQFEEERDPWDAQIQTQDKRNRLAFKKATGRLIVWSVYGFWLVLALAFGVWAFHYITPWCFLSDDQLTKIQSVIFSGTLGAVIATLSKNYIDR